jgi:hypothetical protein
VFIPVDVSPESGEKISDAEKVDLLKYLNPAADDSLISI